MKKITTIFSALIIGFLLVGNSIETKAQILFENFNLVTDSNTTDIGTTLDQITTIPGWTGSKVYQSTGKVKLGTSSTKGYITTPALDLSGNGGNFTIRFKARKWGSDQSQINVFVNTTAYLVTGLNSTDMAEFTVVASGGTAATNIKFEGFQAANGRFFLDDIEIFQSTDPMLIFSPSALSFGGTELNGNVTLPITVRGANLTAGQNVNVAISGTGFTTTTTTLSANTIMTATGATMNVTFNPSAVQDYNETLTFSGAGLSSNVVYNLTGSGINVISVSTIADLRAAAPSYTGSSNVGTTVYKYTGEAVVTHTQAYNNVKYLQDATGAIMIFDQSGKITGINLGDKVTNLMGTMTNYFGMVKFFPTTNCTATSQFNTVVPVIVTLGQLDAANDNPLQAKVIQLNSVTFVQSGNFTQGNYYSLTQESVTQDSVVYTDNFAADYINTAIPSYVVNLKGVCFYKGGATIQNKNRIVLFNRSWGGISNSVSDFSAAQIGLSPNPADNFININVPADMSMEIYSVLGSLISKGNLTEGNNTISVSDYSTGLYILKLQEISTGKTYSAKIQVK
ncbi:MAG TPA: T9SS type A sorting domain-containing protein [Bacteroidales bacterium]|nr:T9SS type A sorting domain-containing protein [Bacteroidales bacterium]HPS70736.1 T9SS type A sorting domain-containing protein [Bacteroidales bacterium]